MNNITGCTFTANTTWDADMGQALLDVARGLKNLTELFQSQGIECLVKITDKGVIVNEKGKAEAETVLGEVGK
jgi:NADPH-dependent 2,4-dienoyl-CoA reductase/sulfur reductase-like enzyme